ncbi:glutathione-dependent formaldehyde-activating enzyme [Xylariaceae sp. FL1651]|nr:glutathione-dependent formaldehyde-activating enzyme [Xylariaceae sp. FL1651]
MSEQQPALKTYRGNCHCAAYVYEFTLPEITKAPDCSCSVCYKKAVIWAFPKPSNVRFVKGDPETMTNHTFGRKRFNHKFCPTCGNAVMVVGHPVPLKPGEEKEPECGFNLRLLQHGQIDVWNLDLNTYDGASLSPAYEEPKFVGSEPTAEVEGAKLYTGSCRCGAVTLAFKSKPLDKDTQGITECNCSICGRLGAVWIYPHKTQVVVNGEENLKLYLSGKKAAGRMFCKICGVPVYTKVMQLTDEEVAAMNEAAQKWYLGSKDLIPLNLRVINGLNVKDLKPNKFDGYNVIQPPYVEP